MLKFQWKGGNKEDGMEGGGRMELREMKRRLQEDGVDPAASDEEKLRHVWQLYSNTEASLKTALVSIEELREQQAEEMREVENYVEHIRSLSDEREALTLEFEAENEQLKADVVRLTNALEGHKVDEIKEMLLQQNLDEIATGTTSEQIAYLLVERARLMDELEAMESRASLDTPDGPMTAVQLFELLEQERQDFEEELEQQRDSLRAVKEKMRRAHEEEMAAMMGENEKLQEMLDDTKIQMNQLEHAVIDLQEQVHRQKGQMDNESGSQLAMETERAGREAAQHDAKQLRLQLQELKADNTVLLENIAKINEELVTARTEGETLATQSVRLESEVESQSYEIQSLQTSVLELQSEKSSLQLRIDLAQDEIHDLKQQSQGLLPGTDLQSRMRMKMTETINTRLKAEIEDLRSQNRQMKAEISEAKKTPIEESAKISSSGAGDNRLTELHEEHERETTALKVKIRSLEAKVSSLEGDLATSQKEVWSQQTEFKKLIAQVRAENSAQDKNLDLRFRRHSEGRMTIPYGPDKHGRHLARRPSDVGDGCSDTRLQDLSSKVKELNERLQVVKAEKDEVFNLLEAQRQQNSSLRQEMGANMARLSSLETSNYQLEADNQELLHKLSRTLESNKEKESQFEENRVLERRASEERLHAAQASVEELQREVGKLREELHGAKQVELASRPEKDGLHTEIDRLHSKHQEELASISQRLQTAYNEVTALKHKLGDREEEVTRLKNEKNLIQSSESSLKTALANGEQEREKLQTANGTLTARNEKAWSEMQQLSIKVASLEATNENLRQELDRKTSNFKETEQVAVQRVHEQTINLENASRRAEAAEARLHDLQSDLEAALNQLQLAESQLRESATLRTELHIKRQEINRLREQLQEEKINKTQMTHGSEELSSQVALLREKERAAVARSSELQHMLLDVEAKLDTMKDQTQNTSSLRLQAESGKKELLEQVSRMQRDLEGLQGEMSTATERYDAQVRKYNERKQRTKNKLQKARELFHSERTKYREEIERLQEELKTTRANMNKDVTWKEQLEDTYRKLLTEKRELLTQVTEQEETVHDQARSLSVLQVRARYLEEENQNLQTRIDSLSRQKSNLDKLIKEYQLERHKEALETMSANMDALMSPRINTNVPSHATTELNNQVQVKNPVSNPLFNALVSPRVPSPCTNVWHQEKPTNRPIPLYPGMDCDAMDQDSDGVEL